MLQSLNAIVLIAEDNKFDRTILKRAFAAAGSTAEIRFFVDGQDLLDHLLSLGDQEEHEPTPALVLLDLYMPRLSGKETLQQIRNDDRLRPVPVVILTSSDHEQHVQEMYSLGANSYLVKPSDFDDLVDTVTGFHRFWSGAARLPKIPIS
jgi:CheY-like chemotaxis protein